MAKKKSNPWLLVGAVGAVGVFLYARKNKEKAQKELVAKVAAKQAGAQTAQGDYIAIG